MSGGGGGTVPALVSDDRGAGYEKLQTKSRKKTVADMIIHESCSVDGLEVQFLNKFIEASTILEPDRKAYLLEELSKSKIGTYINISYSTVHCLETLDVVTQDGEILQSPRTLIFFLGPYVHCGYRGTMVMIVQSLAHKIHPAFLFREIVKVTQNAAGVFSFQFGRYIQPSVPPTSIPRCISDTETIGADKTSSSCGKFELVAGNETPQAKHTESETNISSVSENPQTGSLPNKVDSLSSQNSTGLIADNTDDSKTIVAELFSNSRNLIVAERKRLKAMKSHYQAQISVLRSENKILRRENRVLLFQNALICKKWEHAKSDPHVEILSSPSSHILPSRSKLNLGQSERLIRDKHDLPCLWKDCKEIVVNPDLMWSHVAEEHICSQSWKRSKQ